MNLFGKSFSKKEILKIALLIFGMCAVVSMPIMASFGWFANNQRNTTSGAKTTLIKDTYDIIIERSSVQYDESILDADNNSLYLGMDAFKDKLEDQGFSLTATSLAVDDLAFELVNEYPDLDGSYNLRPGSHGTLTFYLRPHTGMDGRTVDFTLDLLGYYAVYDELEDETTIELVTAERALNILKGHILFFTGRTGATHSAYRYTGLIDDGSFSYDMSEHAKSTEPGKTDCYKILLYWEWPITYDDIRLGLGTKYPSELADYMEDNLEYFFATHQDVYPEEGETPSASELQQLNDGYNDGDQIICDNVGFVALRVND